MADLFLIAGGNPTKVLEFSEHAFDDMALLVLVPVAASLHFALCTLRLALGGITAAMSRCLSQALGLIPFLGQ